MRTLCLIALAALPSVALAIDIDVDGACPGDAAVTVTEITPGGAFALLYGADTGADTVPIGRCAGAVTGLDDVRHAFTVTDGDGDSTAVFTPTLPEASCDQHVQAIDMTTCELTPARRVGGGGGVIYMADGKGFVGSLYTIEPDTGDVLATVPLGVTVTGLAYDTSTGRLYGIAGAFDSETSGHVYAIDPATGDLELLVDSGFGGACGLAAANGRVYAFGGGARWIVYDDTGVELSRGDGDGGTDGADAAADAEGTIWYIDDFRGRRLDDDTLMLAWEDDVGLSDGNGGAATFHEGEVLLLEADLAGNTDLWVADDEGVKTPTGVSVALPDIDAVVSTTP